MKRTRNLICSSHFDNRKKRPVVRCPDNDAEMAVNFDALEEKIREEEERFRGESRRLARFLKRN